MVLAKEIEKIQVIQAIKELWGLLNEEQRSLLIDNVSMKRFKKNEYIYYEDDIPEYLFCLAKGKVKIFKEGIGGRPQIVRMVKPEGFFGYRAGFAGDQYSTSASAFEAVTICQIPLPIIKRIIRENNDVAIYFIKQLANLLRHADEQTVNLTQKHIRGRLAEALLRLKEKYGMEEDKMTLSISLSREDLANLSNMTTSNAIRTLSAFATENLIAIDGKHIKILEEEKLHSISKNG
jgi:CRP-like cAMP-binding protein